MEITNFIPVDSLFLPSSSFEDEFAFLYSVLNTKTKSLITSSFNGLRSRIVGKFQEQFLQGFILVSLFQLIDLTTSYEVSVVDNAYSVAHFFHHFQHMR